ncbi:tRNA threonylcarbamoyladenosine biosynthesis protein TsaB [Seinonella peptonophila]|uniref:tRNA threonylcarbamoyladenosine biosynthesis protein TsaB n=1 Tax=Seinonella peptonophila TaxID=112248 RepID=A0A1M4Y431_9BACL|nr:tRNA (adenosine(37)-N6)-threonylcarbamoyltransferase complex dimerization subunit type 1 TsaB [Seinonella peptonophila]SHF00366.1 tRNA threonylcarbamoyladenosine biosynthesis protein TsaB [Seinonella peptonophila]
MRTLAIDTSTMVMGVAILEQDRVLGEMVTNLKKNHSVRLMPAVSQLLSELDLSVSNIDQIAVTNGPGSYTGIRIGVTTAKTLSWAARLPLYSASSLTVLAHNAAHFPGLIVPLFDARRSRVYAGVYRRLIDQLEPVIRPQVIHIEQLIKKVVSLNEPVLFLGEDVEIHRLNIEASFSSRLYFGQGGENIPHPSHLGLIAWRKHLDNEPPETDDFAPDYLQLTEAEAKWLQKNRRD